MFTIDQFHNPYLPLGGKRVDVVVTLTAAAGSAEVSSQSRVVGFIVDRSGSMAGDRIKAVKSAAIKAIGMLDSSTQFFVVAFNSKGYVIVPPGPATDDNKMSAAWQLKNLTADDGTAMSTGLATAREQFQKFPNALRYAVFLTDGKNESESPQNVANELRQCQGLFETDCWGIGIEWKVGEVQEIARTLLGKASLIPDPSGIEEAFHAAMGKAAAKSIQDVRLRLWTPASTQVAFVKQVNPTIEDLTSRATLAKPQVRDYPTGNWGSGESRDYHVALDLTPGGMDDEVLALRPSVVWRETGPAGTIDQEVKPPESRVLVTWADDDRSTRIEPHVAHYTGQAELAQAIQTGLARREAGDETGATQLLGRAVKIAYESQNDELTSRLRKLVDVIDPAAGTVKPRKADKVAEMDLLLESTTTKRSRRPDPSPNQAGS
jgi:Mg-chelatase subunit ChlD